MREEQLTWCPVIVGRLERDLDLEPGGGGFSARSSSAVSLSSRTISGSVTHSVMRGVAVLPPRSLPGVLTRFAVGQLRDADWPCVVLWVCGW